MVAAIIYCIEDLVDQVGAGKLSAHNQRSLLAQNDHCAKLNVWTPPPAAIEPHMWNLLPLLSVKVKENVILSKRPSLFTAYPCY